MAMDGPWGPPGGKRGAAVLEILKQKGWETESLYLPDFCENITWEVDVCLMFLELPLIIVILWKNT